MTLDPMIPLVRQSVVSLGVVPWGSDLIPRRLTLQGDARKSFLGSQLDCHDQAGVRLEDCSDIMESVRPRRSVNNEQVVRKTHSDTTI